MAEGGLKATATSTWDMCRSTMGVSSGKWYFEVRCNAAPDNEGWMAGIHEMFGRDNDGYWIYNGTYTAANYGYAYAVQDNNQRRKNGSSDDTFDTGDIQPNDIVGIRMDSIMMKYLYRLMVQIKVKCMIFREELHMARLLTFTLCFSYFKLWSRQNFHGQETAGGNTDANGQGDFKYSVLVDIKQYVQQTYPTQQYCYLIKNSTLNFGQVMVGHKLLQV